jgi:hypothetical protein
MRAELIVNGHNPTNFATKRLRQTEARRRRPGAKELGMTPRRYLKHLVVEDLEISNRAKTTTLN